MQLTDLQGYVWENLDLTVNDLSRGLLTHWANEGQRQVLKSRPRWSHLEVTHDFTTIDGQQEYDLQPTDMRTISAADNTIYGQLAIVDEAEAKAHYWFSTSAVTGWPEAISRWTSNKIHVWPTPQGTYAIHLMGYRSPKVMVASSDEPDLPLDLHDAVGDWMLYRAYLHQNDPALPAVHKAIFDETVAKYGADEDRDDDARPMVLGGGFGQIRRSGHYAFGLPRPPGLGEFGGF